MNFTRQLNMFIFQIRAYFSWKNIIIIFLKAFNWGWTFHYWWHHQLNKKYFEMHMKCIFVYVRSTQCFFLVCLHPVSSGVLAQMRKWVQETLGLNPDWLHSEPPSGSCCYWVIAAPTGAFSYNKTSNFPLPFCLELLLLQNNLYVTF